MLKQAFTICASAKQARGQPAGRGVEINHVHSYSSTHDPDAALVDALRSREVTAFDNVIKRHERRLLRVAEKITKNREAAEDAVQDSFLKVFKHLDSFRGDSQFASWLTRITINQTLMAMRVKTQKLVSLDECTEREDGMAMRQIEARGYTPEQLCSQHEFECLLSDLAASLRESSRRVFELHIKDLSGLEIARVLGLTPSAVKARLLLWRTELSKRLSVALTAQSVRMSQL